nr:MAG TPA: hypothetical protein [Caudoviricetes sp.]
MTRYVKFCFILTQFPPKKLKHESVTLHLLHFQ